MKVHWTQTAFDRLAEIKAIKAAGGDSARARQWLDSVFAAATELQKSPHLGRELPEAEGTFREVALDGYRMIYKIEGPVIQILTFRPNDGSQRPGTEDTGIDSGEEPVRGP